jgi:hypothetical protein
MKVEDLVTFFLEQAQHRLINAERTKSAESALAAHGKKPKKGKGCKGEKSKSDVICENCGRAGQSRPWQH